jgi:ABC-type methionine transport system permease subunit
MPYTKGELLFKDPFLEKLQLPLWKYKEIIEHNGYKFSVLPAFWDTHFLSTFSGLKSVVGKLMNGITKMLGNKAGLTTTAFIYIVAKKITNNE